MSAGAKKMILFVWLIISIVVLASTLLRAWDYAQSVKDEVISSIVMQPDTDIAGPKRMFLTQYTDITKRSVIYLVINIGVTIFALVNVNDKYQR